MPITNAEKQARWRERNTIVLTAPAADIAEKLVAMEDQKKLRKILRRIGKRLGELPASGTFLSSEEEAEIERQVVERIQNELAANGMADQVT